MRISGCQGNSIFLLCQVSQTKVRMAKMTPETRRRDLVASKSRLPPGMKNKGRRKMVAKMIRKLFLCVSDMTIIYKIKLVNELIIAYNEKGVG